MKKAQGLPISTVILAALGLLVLVVLFAITTGRLGVFSREIQTCPNPCVSPDACNENGGFVIPGEWINKGTTIKCDGQKLACCSVKIPKAGLKLP